MEGHMDIHFSDCNIMSNGDGTLRISGNAPASSVDGKDYNMAVDIPRATVDSSGILTVLSDGTTGTMMTFIAEEK